MGNSKSKDFKESEVRSKKIESLNRQADQVDRNRIKLLLLGAGESGKSTVFKQMKIIYDTASYPELERKQMALVVQGNVISNMRTLALSCDKVVPLTNPALLQEVTLLPEGDEVPIDAEVAKLLLRIWEDSGAQLTWQRRSEIQIQDSLSWFMQRSQLDRLQSPSYVPTVEDILRTRVRTSGIVEESFMIDGLEFMVMDVGGQRNERKKWVHCFDNVTAVIFVAAVSEFDQMLFENEDTYRMDEAVALFDEMCNLKHFARTSMILFLNKSDLFRDKIKLVPISRPGRYEDFPGPCVNLNHPEENFEACYEAALEYFVQLFKKKNQKPSRQVYHHVTCATDTNNIKVVLNACKDIILKNTLRGAGFMD